MFLKLHNVLTLLDGNESCWEGLCRCVAGEVGASGRMCSLWIVSHDYYWWLGDPQSFQYLQQNLRKQPNDLLRKAKPTLHCELEVIYSMLWHLPVQSLGLGRHQKELRNECWMEGPNNTIVISYIFWHCHRTDLWDRSWSSPFYRSDNWGQEEFREFSKDTH